jgi:hypothetical protein
MLNSTKDADAAGGEHPALPLFATCAAAYVLVHAAGAAAAWGLRGGRSAEPSGMRCARWAGGVAYVGGLAVLKVVVLLRPLYATSAVAWAAVFAVTALWECSNSALLFGGAALQAAHGITTRSSLLAAWAIPSQVNVLERAAQSVGGDDDDEERGLIVHGGAGAAAETCANRRHHHSPSWRRLGVRCGHVTAYVACGVLFRFVLKGGYDNTDDATEQWGTPIPVFLRTVLELEAVVVMGACFIQALNVLPLLAQAVVLALRLCCLSSSSSSSSTPTGGGYQVILPYGSFYFVATTRAFWSRWSRPAGQVIRRMFLSPLQGRALCPSWVLIPFMFLLNAQSHFLITIAVRRPAADADAHAKLVFYASLLGYWVLAYGVLAAAAVLEIFFNVYVARQCHSSSISSSSVTVTVNEAGAHAIVQQQQQQQQRLPVWYRLVRGVVAHAAMRVAAYAVVFGVLDLDLRSLL